MADKKEAKKEDDEPKPRPFKGPMRIIIAVIIIAVAIIILKWLAPSDQKLGAPPQKAVVPGPVLEGRNYPFVLTVIPNPSARKKSCNFGVSSCTMPASLELPDRGETTAVIFYISPNKYDVGVVIGHRQMDGRYLGYWHEPGQGGRAIFTIDKNTALISGDLFGEEEPDIPHPFRVTGYKIKG